jgi:hypothetical protein
MRPTATTAHPYIALERAFAFAGLVAAASAATAGCLARLGFGWQAMVTVTMLSLLVCAGAGMWAQDMVARFQRGELARIYATAMQGVRDRAVEQRASQPTRLETLGVAVAALAESARTRMLGRDALNRWVTDTRSALATRTHESAALAARLREDAHTLAEAASGSHRAEADMSTRMGVLRGRAESASVATGELADDVASLTAAVRAVTTQSQRASEIAIQLSETAFNTQRRVAVLADSATALLSASDEVHGLLARAESLADSAACAAEPLAAGVKALAATGTTTLEGMMGTLRAVEAEVAAIVARVQSVADAVEAQHQFGHALAHAASLQADAVGRLLQRSGIAHTETQLLFAELDGFRMPDTRLGAGAAAEKAVERLPGYAEAMAHILSGLPDFQVSPVVVPTGAPGDLN